MKKLFILPAAFIAAASGNAQINSPSPDGYLDRAALMFSNQVYQGALDQSSTAISNTLVPALRQQARWIHAMSLLNEGSVAEARSEFVEYLADYPTSNHAVDAKMAIADCDFYEQKYEKALKGYEDINPKSLDLYTADDYTYRTAYCRMKLGDYEGALSRFNSLEGVKRYDSAAKFYQGYIYYAQGNYSNAKRMFAAADTSSEPGNRAPYYLAQIAYIEHDYDRALSLARANMDNIAEYRPELQRIAGESLYNLGEESQAIPYLTSYVKSVSDPQPSALYILGVSRYKEGDMSGAIDMLSRVTDNDDAMGQSAYLFIGQSYLKQGNVNAALLALEKAYRMDYDSNVQETAMYNYAVARSEGGQTPFGSSVTLFENFLSRYPDSRYAPEVEEYLVTLYMTDNNYEKALESIQKIKNPNSAILTAKQRVLYTLGSRDVAAGRVEQALSRFTEARKLSSYNQSIANECDLWIGDCNYRLGKYTAATTAYNQYLKSSSATGDNRSLAYYDLGYSLFAEKKYSDSRTAFERAVKSPGNLSSALIADAYNRIGDCYYYATDFSHAATNYEKAYELNPDAGDYAMFQKAMMSGLKRDYTSKVSQIDNMITSYPTSGLIPQALLEKAESYVELNQYDNAIATYQTLVKRYPTTAQGRNGYLQLAITQIGQGKKSAAISSYKAVISNYPTSEEAKVAADDLKRLLADEGRLSEYSSFIASVPDAPKFEVSELDELTFQAAEKAYLADNTSVNRLKEYISQYPKGNYEPQALSYLAEAAEKAGNETEALAYATTLVERYPDSELAEDALAIKGNIELNQGEGEKALATFHQLEKRASASRNIHAARLGIMRVARDLGKNDEVISTADALLASSAIPASEKSEITYSRAYALAQTGKNSEALKEYEQLAKDMNDLYGAKAAFNIAQYYYDNGQYKKAQTAVEKLIDSNTPHSYWLARGYILLSDVYRKQGSTFEANEYLRSLKENYPGTESDIFLMIDQRLK